MNIVKTIKADKAYAGIVASLSGNDIINGYFGGSNLLAEYINDYSISNLNFFIAEWINENKADLDQYDINFILENPDWIMQQAVTIMATRLILTIWHCAVSWIAMNGRA